MHNRYTQSSTFISQNFERKRRKKTHKSEEKNYMARLILIWQNAFKWEKKVTKKTIMNTHDPRKHKNCIKTGSIQNEKFAINRTNIRNKLV